MQMARLTALVAGGLGVKKATVEDYIINNPSKYKSSKHDEVNDNNLDIMPMEEVQAFFGMIAEPME